MDFLKKAMSSSSSSKPAADPNAPAAQKEDYADKGEFSVHTIHFINPPF